VLNDRKIWERQNLTKTRSKYLGLTQHTPDQTKAKYLGQTQHTPDQIFLARILLESVWPVL
jgi:hypothetical protein